MSNVPETFGNMVFNDRVMQERLPKEPGQIHRQCRRQRHEGLGRGKRLHP